MPELPDIELYLTALRPRILDAQLDKVRIANPFLLRSVDPPLSAVNGRKVVDVRRLGKRIVFQLETDLYLILHLMISGRLAWKKNNTNVPKKVGLAAFDFSTGSLILTEAGSKRRASLYLEVGEEGLLNHDPGGIEVLEVTQKVFSSRLTLRNHTLKRALCDPSLFSGIGNAYSDEILHAAGFSPFKQTQSLNGDEMATLFEATKSTLKMWAERLQVETGTSFPTKVTAFRKEMSVHGKFGEPCPVCATPVQRVKYASNETNYCPVCQTEGRLLKDRGLARLLKEDWPKSIDELDLLPGLADKPKR